MELKIEEMSKNIVILNDTIPPLKNQVSSYDDILSKMGMYVENGKITLVDNKNIKQNCVKMECSKVKCAKLQNTIHQQTTPLITDNQNSYIYNKYFKNSNREEEEEKVPLTKEQIIQKLIQLKIQRQRVSQMKSTKLIMPTENIHFAPENNFNRLFGFSKR
jgi:hypothetical protein